jgi:alanyl-tRNA synthetase
MKAQEIRETFLDFFSGKGHKIVKSSPLLPQDDPTILFTNAGMNQFKNIFLGLETRSYSRAASVQKCMRVSGKHNDLEQVGRTSKHHTFFEMLGNFSFGDYFKKEAVEYAWELITEVFKLDKKRLYITVYEEDEDAFNQWNKGVGLSSERIFRFGKKDNYWSMGETGPCGPCSEIHYDLRETNRKGSPRSLIENGDNSFFELWNLVFMQFYQDEKGELHDLPSPSIDTGMGLERIAAVLQGKINNFDTDLFMPLIDAVSELCQIDYPSDNDSDIYMRIIADHLRAITFLIGDGILPANEGRGYVLRRLIRRAYRKGNVLGKEEPFLYKLAGVVIDSMKDYYPELLNSSEYISKICLSEEQRFSHTLSAGIRTFSQYVEETKKNQSNIISGKKIFKLYDTFGFPLELSQELAEEENLIVDEKGFSKELENQRKRARLAWKGEEEQKKRKAYEKLKNLRTEFIGYSQTKYSGAKVISLFKDEKKAFQLKEGESAEIFLDKTPFYAEAGGQIGDIGILKNPYFSAVVENTYYPLPGIISQKVKVLSGKVKLNDTVDAEVELKTRNDIRRNHTSTHLLHASLRRVLGDHVMQAGSLVSPSRFRFDFTHFSALDRVELLHIEELVNQIIREDILVDTQVVDLEEGIKAGAMAIFEEKYAEKVRMVTVGDFSKELCGGIHVNTTGEIGLFKIISETSIAAGMRRIEAVTGEHALQYVQETEGILEDVLNMVTASRKNILPHLERLKDSLKAAEKENKVLRQKLTSLKFKKKPDEVISIGGIKVLAQKVEGLNITELRELADNQRQKLGSGVVVLGSVIDKKVIIVSSVTKDITDRLSADKIIKKIAPIVGGGGGGRIDFAQAGGSKTDKLEEALKESKKFIKEIVSKSD